MMRADFVVRKLGFAVITLLVVIVFIAMLQDIAQHLADLDFLGEADAGSCPACKKPGGGSDQVQWLCRCKGQVES